MIKKGLNPPKRRVFEYAIRRALAARNNGDMDKGLNGLAHKLVREAMAGEQWAIKEIADRLDGKPSQAITGDDDGPPIKMEGRIRLVKPEAK